MIKAVEVKESTLRPLKIYVFAVFSAILRCSSVKYQWVFALLTPCLAKRPSEAKLEEMKNK
ncbi:MAG: hypothetical protein FWD05_11935 [Oscillospiraceae bacterium]|nr:hypothetical protein [Oscillospiraceae bacterium]